MTSESRRSRSTSGQRKAISLRFKVNVIQAYEAATDAQKTFYCIGKEFGVQTGQVSRWVKAKDKITARAVFNPSALTVNAGRPVTNPAVEAKVLEYFNTLQQDDIAISTNMLIIYALSVDSDFHGGQPNALKKWVYMFLQRHNLVIRRPTRRAQKRSGQLTAIMEDFGTTLVARFAPFGTLAKVAGRCFVNMDETPLPLEPEVKTTIATKGSRTVSARKCTSSNPRVTVCLAIVSDGTKLPPFVVFKGVPGARIDSNLEAIVPAGLFATCQEKAFMDSDLTKKWFNSVWKPHVANEASRAPRPPSACQAQHHHRHVDQEIVADHGIGHPHSHMPSAIDLTPYVASTSPTPRSYTYAWGYVCLGRRFHPK
ncbi:hypothetical protein H257_11864 [Aphanomyces astaci]|uniref:HTH CENPB-type domain-containing protein n=1 Tax=Aphanomyces astaci TaxID=112090 RepID=W4G2S5_APHAT|nr:hypothetical protein H257_11864 [Aphanomyces astaci]ETV73354.1 hypothetical protein H257_11864 [Aphanomyces astaci]|eukprot:XP_009837229.1 hypothetical protein H257_11864 [Aphanomyces astaci]